MAQVPAIETMPDVMTADQVAKILRIGRNLVYDLVRLQQIPSFKCGRKIRFSRRRIVEWLGGDADAVVTTQVKEAQPCTCSVYSASMTGR
jgi:excisionase family DNA binding protein